MENLASISSHTVSAPSPFSSPAGTLMTKNVISFVTVSQSMPDIIFLSLLYLCCAD